MRAIRGSGVMLRSKSCPRHSRADADRLHRFEQEARAAAALNHPNILARVRHRHRGGCAVHRVGAARRRDASGTARMPARSRSARRLSMALQIAHGLAAAHDKGIMHRDLKPENVFVTRDNRVKILDFGSGEADPGSTGARRGERDAATMPSPTEPGVVLGTVGYMAPEQVRGLPVDHRADLFAFGAILYELLSGVRAFRRDTAPETMAAILNEDPPDLSAAAAALPPALVRIVDRCLEKNPSARFQTASDLAFALDGLSDASSVSTTARAVHGVGSTQVWLGWAAAAVLLATLAPVAYQHIRERPVPPSPMRFQISPIVEFGGPGNFGLSPDGRHLAFVGLGSDGIARLWIRAMDSLEVRPLPGSETVGPHAASFLVSRRTVRRVRCRRQTQEAGCVGRSAANLVRSAAGSVAVGGSWNRDGDIIVGNFGGLLRVRETGGAASPITAVDPSRKEEVHLLPSFLPDGRHFVYLRVSPSAPEASGAYVGTLDAKPEAQSTQRLMPYAVGLTYAAAGDSGPGRLLFLREGTLMAQPFDARRLALSGDPVPVAEHVGSFRDGGFFSVSANDVLVYRTADTDSQLAWFDRQGAVSGRVSEPGGFRSVALSPDGARAVASRTNPQDTTKADLWLFDLSRGSGAERLTLGAGIAEFPVWSPDGKRIVFTFNSSLLRQKLASGEGDEKELLRTNSEALFATGWSPDGRFLLYHRGRNGVEHAELRSLGASRQRLQACAVRADWIQRRTGPVFAEWAMGCLRLEPVRPERSLRPRVCDGLQQRLGQQGRQRAGVPRRWHGTTLAWGWPRALLSCTERENDGRRRDGRTGVPRRDADAALSDAARRDRRRRDRGRQAISPRDAGRAERIGAVHRRVELERRAEAARADQEMSEAALACGARKSP